MTAYNNKPTRFLERLYFQDAGNPVEGICCAGFNLSAWRCVPFADHLIEWIPEYALPEEELRITHANMYVKLKQAAVRIYTSPKYSRRGEAGEIALHAICRDFFGTIPITNRVFYKSASNDVIKAFDLVHARVLNEGGIELWLGESKFYNDTMRAISDAIVSVTNHLDLGFLTNQKLLLGPQIPKTTPNYNDIIALFQPQTSIDKLISSGVFVIGILSDSKACNAASVIDQSYKNALEDELKHIMSKLKKSRLCEKIRIALIYVPLSNKEKFAKAFDTNIKALQ